MIKRAQEANPLAEANRLADQTDAMIAAMSRRLAETQAMPGLGSIRADRTIPIKSRKHSVFHKARHN
jgi:hypothetical protein